MKKYLLIFSMAIAFAQAGAQPITPVNKGVFILNKFENPIGKETFYYIKGHEANQIVIRDTMNDRGTPFTLQTQLSMANTGKPLQFSIKGKTSAYQAINDTIAFEKNTTSLNIQGISRNQEAQLNSFPVPSYTPAALQQELIRFWKKQQMPARINILPVGTVSIHRDGLDTFIMQKKKVILERLTINGLIWGNEFAWIDKDQRLIGLLTADDSFDQFEMVDELHTQLLPEMIRRSAIYGSRLLKNAYRLKTRNKSVIAITGALLVDVNNEKAIPNSLVVIDHGLIRYAGPADKSKIPSGAQIIVAKGKTILPGLWDMHAHFGQAEWGSALLAAGITTTRDCTNEADFIGPLKKAIDSGNGIGPLVLKAGLIDGTGDHAMGIVQAGTKKDAIAAVDWYKQHGYVQIKIYSTVTPAIVKIICDEAHKVGLTVTGHIPDKMSLQQAVDSGMDMVNHAHYIYSAMKRDKGNINFTDPASVAVIDLLKQRQIVVDPTVGSLERVMRPYDQPLSAIEPELASFPEPLQRLLNATGMDAALAAQYKPMYNSILKLVKVLYDAGVPVVAGSDQGFPGYSLDRELEIYVQAGLTPMQAIKCATIIPAKAMKMDNISGSVNVGKRADLLIVDGNPLENINELRKVSVILKNGRMYDPVQLRKAVGFTH